MASGLYVDEPVSAEGIEEPVTEEPPIEGRLHTLKIAIRARIYFPISKVKKASNITDVTHCYVFSWAPL